MLNITEEKYREEQYRNDWVNAEREFAINSFSSMSWYLTGILQTREDRIDIEDAEKALDEAKKRGTTSIDDLVKELGI